MRRGGQAPGGPAGPVVLPTPGPAEAEAAGPGMGWQQVRGGEGWCWFRYTLCSHVGHRQVYTRMHANRHAHTHTHTHAHRCTRTHTHTHTHTGVRARAHTHTHHSVPCALLVCPQVEEAVAAPLPHATCRAPGPPRWCALHVGGEVEGPRRGVCSQQAGPRAHGPPCPASGTERARALAGCSQ